MAGMQPGRRHRGFAEHETVASQSMVGGLKKGRLPVLFQDMATAFLRELPNHL